eukprot:3508319-Karenia_brevis.AAC.1
MVSTEAHRSMCRSGASGTDGMQDHSECGWYGGTPDSPKTEYPSNKRHLRRLANRLQQRRRFHKDLHG